MMVDDREGEVAAALSRLARRYFSPKYPNISIWVFQYFHLSISILASNFWKVKKFWILPFPSSHLVNLISLIFMLKSWMIYMTAAIMIMVNSDYLLSGKWTTFAWKKEAQWITVIWTGWTTSTWKVLEPKLTSPSSVGTPRFTIITLTTLQYF